MLDPFFSVGEGLDGVRVGIAALSLAASVAYFGFMQRARSAHRTLAKTICFSFLSFLPLTYLPVFPDELAGLIALSLALVLSAVGDMFLAVGDERKFFIAGLSAFLLAHGVYIAGFVPFIEVPSLEGVVLMVICAVAALSLVARLWPRLGRLRLPVLAYFGIIMVMVGGSLSIPMASVWLPVGAVIFAVSDSLIAVRKFMAPFAFVNELVWGTYVVAQFLITGSMLEILLVP
jgi:uncharacterized membrane protein YhhN